MLSASKVFNFLVRQKKEFQKLPRNWVARTFSSFKNSFSHVELSSSSSIVVTCFARETRGHSTTHHERNTPQTWIVEEQQLSHFVDPLDRTYRAFLKIDTVLVVGLSKDSRGAQNNR